MEKLPSLAAYCQTIEPEIIQWRQSLHQIPELDRHLPLTSAFIQKELIKMGLKVPLLESCSGIVGLIEGERDGRTVALRADMDALPIKEETGLPFSSVNGNMHACGHDAHAAMLLGAAKSLIRYKDQLQGNVKLLFQPAEEMSGGAKTMIEEGVLEDPKVDMIFGQHIGTLFPDIQNNQIGVFRGIMTASQDHFTIQIMGQGCHGAMPAEGVDPVVIAANVIMSLQTFASREISGTDSLVLSIGKIHGGVAYNIIPDSVTIEGSVRAIGNGLREFCKTRIRELVTGVVFAMRGTCSIEYHEGYPSVVNDSESTDFLAHVAAKIVGPDNVINIKTATMGSEDMAYFLEEVPGSMFFLASIPKGDVYPHHNSKFDINEQVLWIGSAILSQTAFEWLSDVGI